MKRPIAILLGLALMASAGAVFARGGGGNGGGRGGHAGVSRHSGVSGHVGISGHVGHLGGRPVVGVRHGPVFVGRPHHGHRHVGFGGAVVIGVPFFYPYYPYYPYYPPMYAAPPAYTEPPAYIEQGGGVYYYCPDYRDYYPNVSSCPSQWEQISATASETPR